MKHQREERRTLLKIRSYQRKKNHNVAEGKLYTLNRKVGNYTESLGGGIYIASHI